MKTITLTTMLLLTACEIERPYTKYDLAWDVYRRETSDQRRAEKHQRKLELIRAKNEGRANRNSSGGQTVIINNYPTPPMVQAPATAADEFTTPQFQSADAGVVIPTKRKPLGTQQ